MKFCFLIAFWVSLAASAAQLEVATMSSTNQQCAILALVFPPPPLSCDSANDSSLKAYYKMDETSGDALDSKNSNNLTDHNGVTAEAGKIGGSRNYTATTSQYHSHTDNSDLSASGSLTIAAWVRFGGTLEAMQYPGIISKWTGPASGQNEYTLFLNGDTNRYSFVVTDDGTTEHTILANSLGDPSPNVWHYVISWYDDGLHTLNIQVDDGPVDSVSYSGGVFDGTSDFTIGSIGPATFTWTGQLEEVAIWNRPLSLLERKALYGQGRACRPLGL